MVHPPLPLNKSLYFNGRSSSIEGPESVPPEVMFKIKEEIEEIPTLYSFDIVDFNIVSENFKKEAKKGAEYVK